MHKNQFRESATRTSMFDDITAKRQSEMSPSPTKDRTHLDFETSMLEIAREVGPNTFISFVHAWSSKTPTAGLNPKAKYKTPHGFYAYPLDKMNFVKFIQTGKPTAARFQVDCAFFHIVKVSSQGSVKIREDDTTDKYTNINSVAEAASDIKEIFRLIYLSNFNKIDIYPKHDYDPSSNIDDYKKSITSEDDIFKAFRYFKSIDTYYKEQIKTYKDKSSSSPFFNEKFFREEYLKVRKEFYRFMVNAMYRLSLENAYKSDAIKAKSPGYLFHVVYYSALKLIENTRYHISSDEKVSTDLSNFLYSIGIKSIVDKGSSTIHANEPSQAVVINQGPESNYELIGTYRNYTTNPADLMSYIPENSNKRLEALIKVIQDSSNNITETSISKEDDDEYNAKEDNFNPAKFKKNFHSTKKVLKNSGIEESKYKNKKMLKTYSRKQSTRTTETYVRHVINVLKSK